MMLGASKPNSFEILFLNLKLFGFNAPCITQHFVSKLTCGPNCMSKL